MQESTLRTIPEDILDPIRAAQFDHLARLAKNPQSTIRIIPAAVEEQIVASGRIWYFDAVAGLGEWCFQTEVASIFAAHPVRWLFGQVNSATQLSRLALSARESLDLINRVGNPLWRRT